MLCETTGKYYNAVIYYNTEVHQYGNVKFETVLIHLCESGINIMELKKCSFKKWGNIPRVYGSVFGINVCERGVWYYTTKKDTLGTNHRWGDLINYPGTSTFEL